MGPSRRGETGWDAFGVPLMAVKGMRPGTCLAIYLMVTNMSKMAFIKSATLNSIEIPTDNFTILG